jgi:outer membrane immunogenic protein
LVLPNLLLFGTAGIGFDHATVSVTPNATAVPTAVGDSASVNEIGWVAGAGLEYKWFEHLLLRVEYLHYDFGKSSVALIGENDTTGASINANINHQVDVVLGGIAYKF